MAAAMADLAAVTCVLLRFVPLGRLAAVLAAVPFALVGERCRLRACLAAGLSGCAVGFLLGGLSCANTVLVARVLARWWASPVGAGGGTRGRP